VPPTPDNYRAYYHKIAGTKAEDSFPEKSLKAIASALPRNTPERLRAAQLFESAVASGQWALLKQAVIQMGNGSEPPPKHAWGQLISSLLNRFETRHAGLTVAQKRSA
ncbi:hypothetical protein V6O07_20700, partial [Arthrospira platensis SPKY2]